MDKFSLVDEADAVNWRLEKSGKFSVKSMYNGLTKNNYGIYHKRIWKGKISPKIKSFMWLRTNDAVLAKDRTI